VTGPDPSPAPTRPPGGGRGPFRALLVAGTYVFDNVGDIAMCQVGAERVRRRHPGADLAVVAASQDLLDAHGLGSTTAVPDDAWRSWSKLVLRWHRRFGPATALGRLPFRFPRAFLTAARLLRQEVAPGAADWVEQVRSVDLVVLCGMGALHDGSRRRVERMAHLLLLADGAGTPVVAAGQGIGPLTDPELVPLVARALGTVRALGLRESWGSVPTVERLGVPADRWAVTGDDAIQSAVDAGLPDRPGLHLGISLRDNRAAAIPSEVPEAVAAAIGAALPGVPLELISMMEKADDPPTVSDLALLRRVRPEGDPPATEIPATVPDALDALARCRLVVTGTYHAAVFAQCLGVPVVALAASDYYRQKMHGALDQFGGAGGVVLDPSAPGFVDDLAAALRDGWEQAPSVRDGLRAAAEDQADRAATFFRERT
jgi:polysaccharide pyruvyl transferase WcaK-like protein